jgi:uncharacterized protein
MVILIIISFLYALYEYHTIKTTYLKSTDFDSHNPLFKKRIVFISDLQYDSIFGYNHFASRKLVKIVNHLQADYLIIGGDIIHKKRLTYPVFDYLDQMQGHKIAVLGNHDYHDIKNVRAMYKRMNIMVLVNECLTIDGITFVGVDDLRDGKPVLPPLDTPFNILLTHEPDYFETRTTAFNIALAGHLHGGQITIFGKYAPILPTMYKQKYRSGMVSNGISKIYVSKGLGGSVFGFPLRFFAPPEVVVIDL